MEPATGARAEPVTIVAIALLDLCIPKCLRGDDIIGYEIIGVGIEELILQVFHLIEEVGHTGLVVKIQAQSTAIVSLQAAIEGFHKAGKLITIFCKLRHGEDGLIVGDATLSNTSVINLVDLANLHIGHLCARIQATKGHLNETGGTTSNGVGESEGHFLPGAGLHGCCRGHLLEAGSRLAECAVGIGIHVYVVLARRCHRSRERGRGIDLHRDNVGLGSLKRH